MYEEDHDPSSKPGAQRLAAEIAAYWRARGFHGIKAVVQPIKTLFATRGSAAPVYGVISNIGPNGYPPKEAT